MILNNQTNKYLIMEENKNVGSTPTLRSTSTKALVEQNIITNTEGKITAVKTAEVLNAMIDETETNKELFDNYVTENDAKVESLELNEIWDDETPTKVNIGGVEVGENLKDLTLKEILKKMFYPVTPPEPQLPYFATTLAGGIETPAEVIPTEEEIAANAYRFESAPEQSEIAGGEIKGKMKFPVSWGELTGVKLFNIITQEYDWQYGDMSQSVTAWTKTTETINVDGVDVEYNAYVYNDADRGSVKIEAHLTK